MPHGTPDWGLVGPKSTVYGLDDLGEHAVRLGSPHMWDRRGDMIQRDIFAEGLSQCEKASLGDRGAVALYTGNAWQGAYCARLTTGNLAGDYVQIRYRHGLSVASRLGLEFSFTLHEDTQYIYWRLERTITPDLWVTIVRLDFQNGTLECWPNGGPWTEFATGLNLIPSDVVWQTGKLVGDYSLMRYVRFILNNQEWDLGAHAIAWFPGGASDEAGWAIFHYTNVAAQIAAYVDCVVITQNEP